jgi:putative transcription factor
LRCEVCGGKIYGKPYKVMIEGAKLTVCNQCSKHGTTVWEEPKTTAPKSKTSFQPLRIQSQKIRETTLGTSQELVEKFDQKIRQAREKLGLSHEELGKKINEKVSLLKKIETGKMTPNNKLAAKLEYALRIKLLVPATEEKVPQTKIPKPASRELTLGDLIQLNKKEKEEPAERKPS